MEFFRCHRDRPGSMALWRELAEEHRSSMDRYAGRMIARGPALTDDGETATGSVHLVDLPDPAAARAFASDEPDHRAGVYWDVMLRRWRNALERTMWDSPGGTFPAARPGATGSSCSASDRGGPPTSPCRATGTS
jgi:hypothetical protein